MSEFLCLFTLSFVKADPDTPCTCTNAELKLHNSRSFCWCFVHKAQYIRSTLSSLASYHNHSWLESSSLTHRCTVVSRTDAMCSVLMRFRWGKSPIERFLRTHAIIYSCTTHAELSQTQCSLALRATSHVICNHQRCITLITSTGLYAAGRTV